MLHDYPDHAHNPAPHGGDAAAWIAWASNLPVVSDLGAHCTELGPDGATLVLDASPWTPNPNGSVHGGVVAALADCAIGCAFMAAVVPGQLPATANLTVEYHRPAFAPLTFRARVTSRGRTLLFCHVDVVDRDGRLCNVAHGVMAIRGRPLADPANER